jgi:hypothetical protein
MKDLTISARRVVVLAALLAAAIGHLPVVAQVKTNVPDVIAGARPAIVERIKIHGTALEGNLEGDAVDRDALVFLPPSYHQNRTRRYPVVYALHSYSIGAVADVPPETPARSDESCAQVQRVMRGKPPSMCLEGEIS